MRNEYDLVQQQARDYFLYPTPKNQYNDQYFYS